MLRKDKHGTLVLPRLLTIALLKVAAASNRIIHPHPYLAIVDLELDKATGDLSRFQVQGTGALIERGVIGRARPPGPTLLLACFLPVRPVREIRSHFADGVFNHTSAIDEGQMGEPLSKGPA